LSKLFPVWTLEPDDPSNEVLASRILISCNSTSLPAVIVMSSGPVNLMPLEQRKGMKRTDCVVSPLIEMMGTLIDAMSEGSVNGDVTES
jgi:hypothetical protein